MLGDFFYWQILLLILTLTAEASNQEKGNNGFGKNLKNMFVIISYDISFQNFFWVKL